MCSGHFLYGAFQLAIFLNLNLMILTNACVIESFGINCFCIKITVYYFLCAWFKIVVLKAGAYWQVLKLIWISKVHNSYLLRWDFFPPLQKHLKSIKFQKYYSFLHRGMVRVCSNQFDRVRLKRKDSCFQSIWVIRVGKKKLAQTT